MKIVLVTYHGDDFDTTPVSLDGFMAFISRPDRPKSFGFFIDDELFTVIDGKLTTETSNIFVLGLELM